METPAYAIWCRIDGSTSERFGLHPAVSSQGGAIMRSKLLALLFAFLCVCAALPAQITLSHSINSTTVGLGNSVACGVGGTTTDFNAWARSYTVGAFGVTSNINLTSVSFGVENAADAAGFVNLTINLYLDPVGIPGMIPAMNILQLVHTETFAFPNLAGGPAVFTHALSNPVIVTPADTVVVELTSPNLIPTNGAFFIGSNNMGQTGPSFIRAPGCAINALSDAATIGFPNMHLILDLNGVVCGAATYPGTCESLSMTSAVGTAPLDGASVKTISAGQVVTVSCSSPNGAFDGLELFLAGQIFFTGGPPPSPFPGIAVNPFGAFVVLGGSSPVGSLVLPTTGFTAGFVVPPLLGSSSVSFLLQFFVPTPLAANSIFASTDAHEFQVN
jgi:hypothetical protein